MATKSLVAQKDNSSHRQYGDDGKLHRGRGANTRLLIGRLKDSTQDLRIRSFIRFAIPSDWWDDVESVTDAYIEGAFAGSGDLANGNQGRIAIRRITSDWDEHSHTTFQGDDYEWPGQNNDVVDVTDAGSGEDDDPYTLNCRKVLRQIAPKTVHFPGIGAGVGHTNYGFSLCSSPESNTAAAIQIWAREAPTSGFRPTLTIVYEQKNVAPVAGLIEPSGNVSSGFDITGTFQDDNEGEYMSKVTVQFRKDTASDWDNPILTLTKVLRDVNGDWTIPSETWWRKKFKRHVNYEARASVYDRRGKQSSWTSPVNAFEIIAADPTVIVEPVGTISTTDGLVLTAPWTIDAAADMVQVDVSLGRVGFLTPIWSNSYPPTLAERNNREVRAKYLGPNLKAGFYEWRVRVTDDLGGVSDWASDDSLHLTVGEPADENELDLTTGFDRVKVAQRIVLKRIRASDRGPGAVVGILEDASNIGFSCYASAPGELYFTLPANHPQVSVVEPMTTHYSYQIYRGGRWKEIGAGLIRDFDANGDDMVAYGIDYLGLVGMTVEAAKQSTENPKRNIPTKVTGTDGSRYFQKTIRAIIIDQLKRARSQDPQSPVKFIQTGRVDSFSTKVTIYASFAERLSFIRGLIDSHKGGQANGQERRSRLRVRYNPAANGGIGAYQFEALDGVGKTRDNLRLEYGSLIAGYRVIALDDFATRVYGIGKVPNHTLPYFSAVDAPGISQADWGSIGRANFWNDIVDEKDLQRRARNMATRMSRIGKRVALGIRVNGIAPLDGYDLLDSFPISINDGVVDTSQYGSGYWTLWGLEYRVYPDEHDEITFILRPRGDTDSIDTDLIPSRPIHYSADLAWGHGPPG